MGRIRNAFDFGMRPYALHSNRWQDDVGSPLLLKEKLLPNGLSMVFFCDDFLGDTLDGNKWDVGSEMGPADLAIPDPNTAGGVITSALGTTADQSTHILSEAVLSGDKNAGIEFRLKVSTVAEVQIECGLVDALTSADTVVVTNVDTPTVGNGADDVAVFHKDPDATSTTLNLVAGHQSTGDTKSDSSLSMSNDTYVTLRIQLNGDDVFGWIFDENGVSRTTNPLSLLSGIEGGTALLPWLLFETTDTTAKTATVDYIAYWADR